MEKTENQAEMRSPVDSLIGVAFGLHAFKPTLSRLEEGVHLAEELTGSVAALQQRDRTGEAVHE